MCGRYAATANPTTSSRSSRSSRTARASRPAACWHARRTRRRAAPDYNMAPTKQAPVVLTRAPRDAEPRRTPRTHRPCASCGCSPGAWCRAGPRTSRSGMRMINARAESVLEKPAFAKAAASRRCLVPAEGWYEWQKSPDGHGRQGQAAQAAVLHPPGRRRRRRDGRALRVLARPQRRGPRRPRAWLTTFTIITTDAEPGLDRIHDRQPLVLEREDWDAWLDPAQTDLGRRPRAPRRSAGPAGSRPTRSPRAVNATRNNGPQLLEPVPASRARRASSTR